MSHFTSIKIKISEKDTLATLLAEYGGGFEIKVWILNKEESWTGELSSVEAEEFISHYKITKEIFLEELKRALTMSDPEVSYSILKDELKGYVFSWKKFLDSGITIKNGEMILQKVLAKDIYEEVLERSFEHNSQLQSRITALEKEKESLLKEKETVLSSLEKAVNEKENFERNIYSQFLSVLNAKKERIAELRESLDAAALSNETASSRWKEKEKVKEEVMKGALKWSQKAGNSNVSRSQKESNSNISRSQKESVLDEEVDPFEVDTDVEEDSPSKDSPRRVKREISDTGSQSFNLDSCEDVSSPVPLLPKRSKVEVKRAENKSSENELSEDDLLDQL